MPNYVENDIFCDDGVNIGEYVKPESVALTITSPPYRNAINYSLHVKNGSSKENDNFRGSNEWSTENYLLKMRKVFDAVYDATIEGGICCIVIGFELDKAELIPLPSYLLTTLLKTDEKNRIWILREEIIWNKVTAGRNGAGNRFGITIQNPYPMYYHPNVMHEYILVLSKGKTNPRIRKEEAVNNAQRLPMNEIMKREIANSTWNIAPVPPRAVAHPCPFPEQIPWRLIQLYSYPNDLVLDPFNGSGQTTKLAKLLGRRYIGFDTQSDYVKIAKLRTRKEKLGLTKKILVPKYEKMDWDKSTLASMA